MLPNSGGLFHFFWLHFIGLTTQPASLSMIHIERIFSHQKFESWCVLGAFILLPALDEVASEHLVAVDVLLDDVKVLSPDWYDRCQEFLELGYEMEPRLRELAPHGQSGLGGGIHETN